MSNKIYQFFEYAYIAMAILSVYVAITNWQIDRNRSYLFAVFAVVAVFMYFFKRKFRLKTEERNKNQNS